MLGRYDSDARTTGVVPLDNCQGHRPPSFGVKSGQTPEGVAQAVGVRPRTVRKWLARYRREGLAGLHDRSSQPHRLHRPTPQAVVERIAALRHERWTGKQIGSFSSSL
jgi:transposase